MLQNSLENLQKLGININKEFFSIENLDVTLLKGVNLLLMSINKEGLKLTAKGFLPTIVVKNIVEVAATLADQRFLHLQKRFYEEEHLSANMSRVVCEALKLIKVQKGKLFLTKKGNEFLTLSPQQQYIILFNIMLGLNIGYFDGHQEAMCVNNSSLIMLQLLRDKDKDFRTAEVYTAILLESYPLLESEIDKLEISVYAIDESELNVFASIAKTRLFERLYLPLGLVNMNVAKYPQGNQFKRSELLESLLGEKYAIKKELVLSKKIIRSLQNEIKENKLDINLFEITMFLFAQYTHYPLPHKQIVIDTLMQKHLIVGALRTKYENFYERLITSILTTYDEFTQLDTIGASKDTLIDEYMNMIDALYTLVATPKPFLTAKSLQIVPAFILDILKLHHNLDTFAQDFILECSEKFNEEFAITIAQLMIQLEKIEKDAKKLHKSKFKFEQNIKEFLQTYMMIVLELRSQ